MIGAREFALMQPGLRDLDVEEQHAEDHREGGAQLVPVRVGLLIGVREFGTETDLAVVLQMRGQARTDMGDVTGGFADLREGLRMAIESGPAGFTAAAHVNLGDNVWFAEGPENGQALYEAGAEMGLQQARAHAALPQHFRESPDRGAIEFNEDDQLVVDVQD